MAYSKYATVISCSGFKGSPDFLRGWGSVQNLEWRFILSLGWWWYRLRSTRWGVFFKTNGPGKITSKNWYGYRESQNTRELHAAWAILVVGGNRPPEGNFYQATVTVPELDESRYSMDSIRHDAKMAEAEKFVLTFADANCRCRAGFHWKCGIHKKWVN